MSDINISDIKSLVNDLLFENKINEKYTPDDFVNIKSTMYDRPGPNISGDNQYDSVEDEEIVMPITADDVVNNTALINRNKNFRDSEYAPNNRVELSSALVSIVDTYSDDEINIDISQKIWKSVTDILDKVFGLFVS